MAPKTKEQFEEQKQEKRKQIMTAALEVFASHGYHGASISHIAKTAGVAKGLIYSYFESKEEMLQAILNEGIKEIIIVFEPALQKELTRDLLKELLEAFFQQLKNNISFWRLYFSIALQPQVFEIIEKELSQVSGGYFSLLNKYYENQGSKNPEADAMMTHALLDGITLNFIMNHHDLDTEKVEKIAIEQVLNGRY